MEPYKRTFVALDTTDVARAVALAETLTGLVGGMKVGKEFFTANGPQGVEKVTAVGMPVFLDLKFHDIPNTVASAVSASLPLKPFMLNVHASGGAKMMEAAARAAEGVGADKPMMLAVTVLTSMSADDLAGIGVDADPADQVLRLARLAKDSGMDGVVCSARESEMLRADLGADFKLVTPGIRPAWASKDDQARIVTPAQAIVNGSDYLVIGRPITGADDPVTAATRIADELANQG